MGNMCTSNLDLCHYLAFVGCVILDLICTIYIYLLSAHIWKFFAGSTCVVFRRRFSSH